MFITNLPKSHQAIISNGGQSTFISITLKRYDLKALKTN